MAPSGALVFVRKIYMAYNETTAIKEFIMSHNQTNVEEPIEKTSKLQKIKNGAITAGVFGIPTVLTLVGTYYSIKVAKMQYETAKMELEAAREAA